VNVLQVARRPDIQIRVTNIVATGKLGCNLDLEKATSLASVSKGSYHCVYVRTPQMHSSVSVFNSGKMISFGTKCEEHARQDLIEAARYLVDKYVVETFVDPGCKVVNIALAGTFSKAVNIDELMNTLSSVRYEPEHFPALIHHPPAFPGISILLFQSGKFVIAGVQNFNQIELVGNYLCHILNTCT
jgi:TATA-box binding protein (TBP) (component of TFIID and TFIIIB)